MATWKAISRGISAQACDKEAMLRMRLRSSMFDQRCLQPYCPSYLGSLGPLMSHPNVPLQSHISLLKLVR